MEKKSNLWFWMLLALFIFLLYCMSGDRLYCATPIDFDSDRPVQHMVPDQSPTLHHQGFTQG